jgi:MAGUK p55 subfamily protein 5
LSDTSRRQDKDEVNGKEYYFITRNHFKEFVSSGKFVEHGEYDGHYYGTSLDSIKEVIDSGKVCVVNLHCQVNNTYNYLKNRKNTKVQSSFCIF